MMVGIVLIIIFLFSYLYSYWSSGKAIMKRAHTYIHSPIRRHGDWLVKHGEALPYLHVVGHAVPSATGKHYIRRKGEFVRSNCDRFCTCLQVKGKDRVFCGSCLLGVLFAHFLWLSGSVGPDDDTVQPEKEPFVVWHCYSEVTYAGVNIGPCDFIITTILLN
jgi:hypothetical protein